jgi:hypothetical protein
LNLFSERIPRGLRRGASIHDRRITMEKKNLPIGLVVLGSILFLSCYKDAIQTTTRIFPDGSCERIVTAEGDSTYVSKRSFPIPLDSSWTITYNMPDKESQAKEQVARKWFPNVKALNREYIQDPDTAMIIHISQKLKKKFRWFNTYYYYEEIYHAMDPFKNVPIAEYFTREELDLYYINADTLDFDKRTTEWWNKATFESFYKNLTDSLRAQHSEEILNSLVTYKDSLNSLILMDKLSEDSLILCMKALLAKQMNDSVKTTTLHVLHDTDHKTEFFMNGLNDYTNEVIMPGLILDTNAKDIEGNSVQWKFDYNRFIWEDYTMWVESRVVNRWAMIATGILCVILTSGLIFGSTIKHKIQEARLKIKETHAKS